MDEKRFDFIYLLNSFEHLRDWKGFLKFMRKHLTPRGKCLVLCPNHSFPYEAHFGLPIIFNKNITYALFRNKIEKYEKANNASGLWSSLNFVKGKDVKKEASKYGFIVTCDNRIVSEIIARLDFDEEFRSRHKHILPFAKVLRTLGIVKLIELPIFFRFRPYMCILISPVAGQS